MIFLPSPPLKATMHLHSHTHREKKLTPDKMVNLYQSHDQTFTGYTMARPPVKRSTSEEVTGSEALARSLSNAFYITSYQSEIAKYAVTGKINTVTSLL